MTLPNWTQGIHHDGSERYVSNSLPTLNEAVTLSLRIPEGAPVQAVFARTTMDGEGHFIAMEETKRDQRSVWYTGVLHMQNKRMVYRFKIMTNTGALYYTARGVSRADAPDDYDFKLVADFESPSWLKNTVFYQIFPERFHNGDPNLNPPEGELFEHPPHPPFYTQLMDWDASPVPFDESGSVDFFGGDLPGIREKLDYLSELGVNALYLNPIFTSPSNHKYNIEDFFNVDPHFGGNEAFVALRQALDARSMYVVLDLTPNHVGNENSWFKDAQKDATSPTAEYFIFHKHPDDYVSWLNVATLPKLNYDSHKLRAAMYGDDDAVMRYWLKAPFRADGWRLDVWNMTGRLGASEPHLEIGREMRQSVKAVNPEAYLFGEHFFDSTPSLQGDAMDATMNYQGFSFPVWRWLAGHDLGAWHKDKQAYADDYPMPAEAAAEQMVNFMAAVPWAITRIQFNQLGSHDTPRILTVVGEDVALAQLGAILLFTFPGVPCIYYGDEVGMTGGRDPFNRAGMIWDKDRWNTALYDTYRQLINLRRNHDALINGGFQWLSAFEDVLAFQRESNNDRLIVVAYRGKNNADDVKIPVWRGGIEDGTTLTDLQTNQTFTVKNGEITITNLRHGAGLILV